jgi:tyrosyl-tRNA synthetase
MSEIFPEINKQLEIIKKGVVELIPEQELVKKLEKSRNENKPLNIKLGCDPTRPDLHLGHSVVIRKLAQFQKLGHQAILIIGDFTAMIGDPSGRNSTRPPLTFEEAKANAETYLKQAYKILDPEKTKIVYNSDWLGKMNFQEVISLASKYTVARMIERDDFTKRFNSNTPISLHEFLYPLAQAMDSVAIESDVELGGTDQKFNLLVGRDIQREFAKEPQVILTMPLLIGTDGVEKMSKSYDNYIGIDDTPQQMFGKTLSIPDNLIIPYFELVTDESVENIKSYKLQMENNSINPRDLKRKLARTIVEMYHSEQAAINAENEFDEIFINKGIPDEMPEFSVQYSENGIGLLDLITQINFAPSNGEARRLVQQGGVSVDNEKISDFKFVINKKNDFVLKVGKRKFAKIIIIED